MTGQTNFLQSLGWAVLNSLWQLALLWVVYQFITSVFRTTKSSTKSSLASSLLIAGFAWFIYTFFSAYTNHAGSTIISSAFVNPGSKQQLNNWLQETLPIASIVYLILLLLPLLHFIRNYRYVQVIRRYGLTKMNVEWRMFVNKVSVQMGIKKRVQIWVSEFVSSPVTIGFLKPVILVPLAAINHLTPQQLEAVLLHELSHIKRFDYLINLIINFIQVVLYFNPFVKAFVKIVEREREKSCDEMVLQFQYDSHEYATALLMLEKTNHIQQQLVLAATGKKNDLLNRVESIMGVQNKSVVSFNKLAGIFAGLLCIITLNALLILNKPETRKKDSSFTLMSSSPFDFFSTPAQASASSETERPSQQIANKVKEKTDVPGTEQAVTPPPPATDISEAATAPEIMNVNYETVEAVQLKKYQEEEVKAAMKASKKVLEEVQWKAVEKNIADVFTQKEKEALKSTYEKELNKLDWNQWENKLRLAYDKIDWEKVNYQLSNAVNQVRLDSLQYVYTKALSQLSTAEKQLKADSLEGIPDTDVTLKSIPRLRRQVEAELDRVRSIRNKKIVHL
jgi:beta-lactamase regulating signal transducer with metallopeptidase domain